MNSHASLSRREHEALTLVARFRFLTRSQLQTFLFAANGTPTLSEQTMTFRILNSLTDKGLVGRTVRSVGGSTGGSGAHAYFITAAGIRALDDRRYQHLARRLPPRGTFLLRHALATADVALAFEHAARTHEGHQLLSFECDFEAALRFGQKVVVPDATLVYQTPLVELHALVEVDLGTAGATFFARKLGNYLALYRSQTWKQTHELWPTVLTITPNRKRAALLKQTAEILLNSQSDSVRLQAGTEFAFTSLPALSAEGPLAPIWEVAGRAGIQGFFDGEPLR